MNALAEASRMLGDAEPSPAQAAQLRALNRKYAQWSYERRYPEEELRARLREEVAEILRL